MNRGKIVCIFVGSTIALLAVVFTVLNKNYAYIGVPILLIALIGVLLTVINWYTPEQKMNELAA